MWMSSHQQLIRLEPMLLPEQTRSPRTISRAFSISWRILGRTLYSHTNRCPLQRWTSPSSSSWRTSSGSTCSRSCRSARRGSSWASSRKSYRNRRSASTRASTKPTRAPAKASTTTSNLATRSPKMTASWTSWGDRAGTTMLPITCQSKNSSKSESSGLLTWKHSEYSSKTSSGNLDKWTSSNRSKSSSATCSRANLRTWMLVWS